MTYNDITTRTLSMCGASRTFGQALIEAAAENEKVIALTADQCTAARLDFFAQKYPNRYLNIGIAEQNMVGVAAGLAKEGFNPFAFAQATFVTNRCYDQFKINLSYMQLGVKMVGFGAGLGIGQYGATHMSLEDIALVRCLPNVIILSPADCTETYKAVIAAANDPRPMYIRLTGGMGNPIVYKEDYDFQIGKSITLKEGKDIAIIATGVMVNNALQAAKTLEEKGYSVMVVDMHTIQPLDTDVIESCLDTKLLVSVEEHFVRGGLGSAIAEHLSMCDKRPRHLILGVQGDYPAPGEYNYLLNVCKLTPNHIAEAILKNIE